MEDMHDVHKYIVLLVATIISIIGFFLKRVINKVDKLETALTDHKEKDVEKYATKDEMRDLSTDFKGFLEQVISPLNRKLESIEVHMRDTK